MQSLGDQNSQAVVAVAATFTAEPLLPGLRAALEEAGLALDVRVAPYGQLFQELLSPASLLATNAAGGVDVVLVRLEDFVRDIGSAAERRVVLERTARELSDALQKHARRVALPTVLAVLPPSPTAPPELAPELEAAGALLAAHAGALNGITLLSSLEVDRVSRGERHDSERDQLAHIPFTEAHYAALALTLARKIHALRVPAHKVLVLDCDNTIWRGVVGEDGIEGISIPPAFACVQRYAVQEQARGTLVCLASKNAEQDVLDVFERRPDMILRAEHVVAHRINWEPKARNLESLAAALNLSLESFVFIDDNPVECAQVQAALPQVVTLQLPPDDEVEPFLARLWTFDRLTVTDEDARRTSMYRENAARQQSESSAGDIAAFITSLGLAIDMAPPQEGEWPRLAQLTQRTTQFNFTTRRCTEAEMRAIRGEGALVLRVKVRDRFGDYGLVGLAIAQPAGEALEVDTFLLSCRVLGRGVEHAVLRRLGEVAKERSLAEVRLPYLPTSRNTPARAFAHSVAAAFRTEQDGRVVYRIPAEAAAAIAHRPGFDAAEVIEARNAELTKRPAAAPAAAGVNRSARYALFARELVSGQALLDLVRRRGTRGRALPGSPVPPATRTERELLALWQEILGVDGLGVDDDYFALGGTSLLAAQLFATIARRFGVMLRLTTILDAPTVRALAREVEQQKGGRGSLVELKGGGARNLFLVHDGDGETLLYLNLARRLPEDVAVFGIEPRCLPGVPLAHTRIEDMAAFYIGEMRKKQPRGPYLLGGMCAGGVIAYEMASQLIGAGEPVALVALLDAATPQAEKRAGRIARQRLGRLAQTLAGARGKPLAQRAWSVAAATARKATNALTWEVGQRARRWSTKARFRLLRSLLARQKPWPRFVPGLSVREIYDTAEAEYAPKPLADAGTVLVRAQVGEGGDTPYAEIYADAAFGWAAVARGLAIVDVAGGHSSMLQEPHAGSLATALLRHLPPMSGKRRAEDVEAAAP